MPMAGRSQQRMTCSLLRSPLRGYDSNGAKSNAKDSDRYKAVNLIGVTVCNSIPHGTHRGPARLRPSVPGSP